MKSQEIEKLRAKTVQELQAEVAKRQKKLVEAKFKLSQGKLNNVHLPNKLRKEIAVIKTIMTEKQSDKKEENNNE
jgi:ribosomal protein L29